MKTKYSIVLTAAILLSCFPLTGCSQIQDGPPKSDHFDASKVQNAEPEALPKSRYGNPKYYTIKGETYHVLPTAKGYLKRGIASWYGIKFHGRLTSTREPYNMYAMTAASTTLPIPCFVKVTNLENGKQVIVKVNDRGPFAKNRIIDLSYAAAKKLDYTKKGTAFVQVTAITAGDITSGDEAAQVTISHQPKVFLQVGAFSEYENAKQLVDSIQQMTDVPINVKASEKHSRKIYRVQAGPLKGVGESDKLKNMLDKKGHGEAITVIR